MVSGREGPLVTAGQVWDFLLGRTLPLILSWQRHSSASILLPCDFQWHQVGGGCLITSVWWWKSWLSGRPHLTPPHRGEKEGHLITLGWGRSSGSCVVCTDMGRSDRSRVCYNPVEMNVPAPYLALHATITTGEGENWELRQFVTALCWWESGSPLGIGWYGENGATVFSGVST